MGDVIVKKDLRETGAKIDTVLYYMQLMQHKMVKWKLKLQHCIKNLPTLKLVVKILKMRTCIFYLHASNTKNKAKFR
jgi:hypothetical protein